MKIQIIYLDNGIKFCLIQLKAFAVSKGIRIKTIVFSTFSQNGPIEQAGKTIIDQVYMSFIVNRFFERYWLYVKEAAVYIINYTFFSINPDLMNFYERWVRVVNYPEAYIKPSIRMLYIWVCYVYIYISNEKLQPRARKMISIVRFGKLYGYKRIYSKIYIVCLDNEKIIRVRDVRFYKRGVPGRNVEKEAFFEVVFDKETEELIFGTICFKTIFGSGKSPALRVSVILRFQEIEV